MNLFYKIVFFIAIIGIFLSVEPFEHEKKDKLYQIANNSSKIVIDGLTEKDISKAMKIGIKSIIDRGPRSGVEMISAGNYGGKLGPHLFHLKSILK